MSVEVAIELGWDFVELYDNNRSLFTDMSELLESDPQAFEKLLVLVRATQEEEK